MDAGAPETLVPAQVQEQDRCCKLQMIHDACLVVYVCGVVSKILIAQMKWCIIILPITLTICGVPPNFVPNPLVCRASYFCDMNSHDIH